jgi:hypothetical protein
MALETELATYQAKLEELKTRAGKYVVIQGTEVVDYFDSYEDALKHGYTKFGLTPFLVKRIDVIEQAHFISRHVVPVQRAS